MIAILSEEEQQYVKLDLLLKGVATRAVRTFFSNEFPSSKLPLTLLTCYNILRRLKKKRVLNNGQWNVLFPQYGVFDSNRLDITLMIFLIRHISAVIPPINGFDKLPLPGETTPGSDLARIKWYRNKIALHPNNRICSVHFNTAWGDISDAVGRLGGQTMYQECAELNVKFKNQSIWEFILEMEQSLEDITERTQLVMNILGTEYSKVTENLTDISKVIVPLSDEEANYTRMSLLLKGVSARAIRTFFDKQFSPTKLSSTLQTNLNILRQLKFEKSLNKAHWNLLFPKTGVADSEYFDVTLMICLIRALTSVTPPFRGFDQLPQPNEKTPESDLARIKWYRTILSHVNMNIMDTAFFYKAWQDISDAVRRLGGKALYQDCIELKVKIFDLDQTCQEFMERIKQLLETIKELLIITNLLDTSKHLKLSKSRTQLKHKECFNIGLQTEQSNVYEYLKNLVSSLETLQIGHVKVKEILEDKIPWNTRAVIKYEHDTFPRLRLLETRLNDYMDTTNYLQSPHIRFICDEKFADCVLLDNKIFAVKGIDGQYIQEHDICKTALIVTVCILQLEESGNLSTQDKMFLALLGEIEADTKKVIYVINTEKCPSSILERCSVQISERMEPFSSVNTIYNRLFAIDSSDISIRISFYFERHLLDSLPGINTNSGLLENTLTSLELNEQMINILAKGPLNENTCLDNLRRNALDFQLDGDRTQRIPWKIQKVRCQVKNNLCECLSKDISLTLMKYLNDHWQMISKCEAVVDELEKMMDMSICWIDQLTSDILGIISIRSVPILAFASTPFSIASDLVFSVDVKDVSFRHQIADYIHEHIMAWRTEIIQDIHHRFKEGFLKKFIKLWKILNAFGKRNKAGISFYEYKTITERNMQIKSYGLFGDIKKIYIHKNETNEESIRAYLCRYFTDLSSVNICQYHKMIVSKHCFKSGNMVGEQNRYGTAGFLMKEGNTQYYCATCEHVTRLVQHKIHSNNGMELFADVHYFDTSLDFSLLKLRNTNIVCNHGIRTRDNCYVSGNVFENDMTPDEDDEFYKWGATTGLTNGKYLGRVLVRKHERYNYDIDNILITGPSEFAQFSKPGDSGSLICLSPDSIVYTSHMAAYILVGEVGNYENDSTPNRHMCYRVSHPLSDMRNQNAYQSITPCFST